MVRQRVAGIAIGYYGFPGVFIVFRMRFPSRGGKPAGSKKLIYIIKLASYITYIFCIFFLLITLEALLESIGL